MIFITFDFIILGMFLENSFLNVNISFFGSTGKNIKRLNTGFLLVFSSFLKSLSFFIIGEFVLDYKGIKTCNGFNLLRPRLNYNLYRALNIGAAAEGGRE